MVEPAYCDHHGPGRYVGGVFKEVKIIWVLAKCFYLNMAVTMRATREESSSCGCDHMTCMLGDHMTCMLGVGCIFTPTTHMYYDTYLFFSPLARQLLSRRSVRRSFSNMFKGFKMFGGPNNVSDEAK